MDFVADLEPRDVGPVVEVASERPHVEKIEVSAFVGPDRQALEPPPEGVGWTVEERPAGCYGNHGNPGDNFDCSGYVLRGGRLAGAGPVICPHLSALPVQRRREG